jgi:hypothetical protein
MGAEGPRPPQIVGAMTATSTATTARTPRIGCTRTNNGSARIATYLKAGPSPGPVFRNDP